MEEMMDRKEAEEEINALLRTQYVDRKFQQNFVFRFSVCKKKLISEETGRKLLM